MEVGVRLVGILLRVLNFLLAPLFWLRARDTRRLPPVTNPILLKSASELAAAIRNGETGEVVQLLSQNTYAREACHLFPSDVSARTRFGALPRASTIRSADDLCIEITSEDLVTIYINRVKEVNPFLNAVVEERYKAAIDDARAIDKQIEEAKNNGSFELLVKDKPLLGVPFTVKESCLLAGLSCAVGCVENAGRRGATDGAAVARARAAGAVALLVSNTPELCLGWETTNLLSGTTNNPYCLNRTPGGSSGGEAALLACGASPFSVSSDIAGSIRLPAAFCGVFGHKPTPGIISIDGHIPTLSDEQFPKFLTVGPMTRRADDLPLLMNIMAGDDKNKLRLDEPVDMKDIKVFYMHEASDSIALLKVDSCITDAIENAVKYLEKECSCTISEQKFKDLEDSVEISISVFFSMKDIPNLLQDPANPKRNKSLAVELIKCAFGGGSRSLQGLSFSLINSTHLFIPDSRREHYNRKANALRDHMQRVLGDNGVLLYPVFSGPAHFHKAVFVRASGVLYSMAFNILGMPATAVPVGLHRGLPVAIQVIAAPYQDRLCLAVAKQLEVGFGGWKPPQ